MSEKKKRKLSDVQSRVLKALYDGHGPNMYAKSRSEYGGLHGTINSLVRNKLIDSEYNLTRGGLDALRSGFYLVGQAKEEQP